MIIITPSDVKIEIDPTQVFLRIEKIVNVARSGRYQFESLAVDLMVKMIERYLAEYRGTFQSAECRRALVVSLDIFVDAGWPKARAVVQP